MPQHCRFLCRSGDRWPNKSAANWVGVSTHEASAWAYFADWGRTEEERAISRDKLQQAIQATVAPALQAGEPGDGHDTTGLTD